jgi:hypothetical protein
MHRRYKRLGGVAERPTLTRREGKVGASMEIAHLIRLNTIVLVVITMLVLVFLFGIARELRKTAEAVGRVEETARDIARFLAEKLA